MQAVCTSVLNLSANDLRPWGAAAWSEFGLIAPFCEIMRVEGLGVLYDTLQLQGSHMGCSPNYGPLLVRDYITAPNIIRETKMGP